MSNEKFLDGFDFKKYLLASETDCVGSFSTFFSQRDFTQDTMGDRNDGKFISLHTYRRRHSSSVDDLVGDLC